MDRREALTLGSLAFAAGAISTACGSPVARAAGPEEHAHHGAEPLTGHAAECLRAGELCLQHCIALLATGDTSMAGCAKAVHDMLAASEALLKLASSELKPLAVALAKAASERCAKECEAHAAKHDACKACGHCCKQLLAALG